MTLNGFIIDLASRGYGENLEYDIVVLELSGLIAKGEESQYGDYIYVAESIGLGVVGSLSVRLLPHSQNLSVGGGSYSSCVSCS